MANAVKWFQHEIRLPAAKRGCHLVTNEVRDFVVTPQFKLGLCFRVRLLKLWDKIWRRSRLVSVTYSVLYTYCFDKQ